MIQKNVPGQGVYFFAYLTSTGGPDLNDAANITGTISRDGGSAVSTATVHPTSIGGGLYWQPFSQAETNANAMGLAWSSTSLGVLIDPVVISTDQGAAGDPWATVLPGSYSAGTAGALLYLLGSDETFGQKLFPGASVSAASSSTVFTLAFANATTAANLVGWQVDLGLQMAAPSIGTILSTVQTDSTHVAVTLVTALSATPSVGASAALTPPPQVATDSAGRVTLAVAGLDSIVIESGVNLRQAMSPVLAAAGGVISGGGTSNILIKAGANPGTTRITSTVNQSTGDRSVVTLNLPS